MISPTQLSELRRLCEEATKGEWIAAETNLAAKCIYIPGEQEIINVGTWGKSKANRDYIAGAQPSVVRSLLDEIERLRIVATEADILLSRVLNLPKTSGVEVNPQVTAPLANALKALENNHA